MKTEKQKLIAVILAAVMFVATLSACESSTDNQESAGGDATTQSPETQKSADPPSGGDSIDHAIVGYWASTDFFTYSEIKTGNYAYSTQNAEGWIFERDGTFHFFLHTTGNRSFNGLSQRKGNYRIEDDRIYCTDVLESWKSYDNPERSHDFRPGNDFMLTYEFRENGKAIGLNRSNLIGDYDPAVYLTHFHYIEEQQKSAGSPSNQIDHPIVGVWGSGIDVLEAWHLCTTGAYESTAGTVGRIEFRANGTFESVWIIAGKKMTTRSNFKGNYKVDGNKIFLTDVMYKFTSVDGDGIRDSSHDYTSVADHNLFFEIVDIGGSHGITFNYDFDLVTDKVYFGESNSFYPVAK